MRIIGIDPGLLRTGYAVIEKHGNHFTIIAQGLATTKKESIGNRLLSIYNKVSHIIEEYAPSSLAVESGFYSKNVDSLVKMSYVKGVVILAARQKGIDISEYSPATVKMAITGRGRATKEQVKFMVEQILEQKIDGGYDISDAISVALCHLYRQ